MHCRAGLAGNAVGSVLDIVAGAVLHHAFQHVVHQLRRAFATHVFVQHHRLYFGSVAILVDDGLAKLRLHHAATGSQTVVEGQQLQGRHARGVAIAEVQEVTVRAMQVVDPCLVFRSLYVRVNLAVGEHALHTCTQGVTAVVVEAPAEITHADVRRLLHHLLQRQRIPSAVVVLDFTVNAAEVFVACRQLHGGVYLHLGVAEYGGEDDGLEGGAGLIDVAHCNVAVAHFQILVGDGVHCQIDAGQHVAGTHLHEHGATRRTSVHVEGFAQRRLGDILIARINS